MGTHKPKRFILLSRHQVRNLPRTYTALQAGVNICPLQHRSDMGISLAELLRWSLRQIIPVDGSNSWMRYAGMVESGDAASSQKIDDVIYGQNR